VHLSLTDSGLRSTSAIVEESYMHGNSRNFELVPGLATVGSEDTADAVDYEESELLNIGVGVDYKESEDVGEGAWVNRPGNNDEESELLNIGVGVDNTESKYKELDNRESEYGEELDYEESEVEDGEDYEESEDKDPNKQFEGTTSTKMFDTEESNSEHQRPTHSTRRPSRFRDEVFKTQFRPKERRQRLCDDPGRRDQGNIRFDNFHNFHKHKKKLEQGKCNNSGRGDQKNVRVICLISNRQSASSPDQREAKIQKSSAKEG